MSGGCGRAGSLVRVSLRLFDSASREVRELRPATPGHVGVYLCGATVQGAPHVGHIRSSVAFDVLWRWLETGHGYDVTFVRNVTDVDDKILVRAAQAGVPWWAWALRHEREFSAAYDTLGLRRPTYEPRATGHATEMVELVAELVERGHAYVAEDDSGDVYFDVRSWEDYGSLTHQRLDDMAPAEDADPRGKRDPRDFALWKGHKPEEPATAAWPAPWGRGRPGWHLECSAMARRYLGDTFDIHAGGIDLRFPHHENEQAQSHAAGLGFANLWLHNAWVTTGGEKMSKSLGNSLTMSAVLRDSRPLALRYYLGQAHYRSTIEFTSSSLVEADAAVSRIQSFLRRVDVGEDQPRDAGSVLPQHFRAAMDDDLNVAGALSVVHETVRAGNTALDAGNRTAAVTAWHAVRAMTAVLGVDPLDGHWAGAGASREAAALDALVQAELHTRARARAGKDYATADAVRDRLAAAGVVVEDTPDGARWSLAAHPTTPEDG